MPDSNNINEATANIQQCIEAFRAATFGEEVRNGLIRVAELCYSISKPIKMDNDNPSGDYILYYEDEDLHEKIEVFNFSDYFSNQEESIINEFYNILDSTFSGNPNISPTLLIDNNNADNEYILYYIDSDNNRHEIFNFSDSWLSSINSRINNKLDTGTYLTYKGQTDAILADTYRKSETLEEIQNAIENSSNTKKNLAVVPEPKATNNTAAFTWTDSPIHGKILTDYNGEFLVDFDVSSFKNTGGTSIYISPNGDDSNSGTSKTSPKKTLEAAYNVSGVKTIYMLPGIYGRNEGFNSSTVITKSINIIGLVDDGEVFVTRHVHTNMTLANVNTYYGTRSHFTGVVDIWNKDEDGYYIKYQKVDTAQACIDTEGSWYYDGSSTAYVHVINNSNEERTPTSSNGILLMHEDTGSSHIGGSFIINNGNVYLENLTCIGGPTPLHAYQTSSSDEINIYAKKCKFLSSKGYYSGQNYYARNAVWIQGAKIAYFQSCTAALSEKDGFNYNPSPSGISPLTRTKAIEVNCIGCKNGTEGDGDDQGSTAHNCDIIRVGGIYYKNTGANVGDEGGATSWNVGCTAFESKATSKSKPQNSNFMCYKNSVMFCDSCTGFASIYNLSSTVEFDDGVRVGDPGYINLRNPKFNGELLRARDDGNPQGDPPTPPKFPFNPEDIICYY